MPGPGLAPVAVGMPVPPGTPWPFGPICRYAPSPPGLAAPGSARSGP